jgi:hypothetical protein
MEAGPIFQAMQHEDGTSINQEVGLDLLGA